MRIDVHGHYLPPDYVELMARLRPAVSQDLAIRQQGGIDERIGMLDESGVDLQVLSLGSNVPYLEREADAVAAARLANDIYADVARQHAGRLGAFGAVPLPHVDAAIAEANRCLDQLGMPGIALGCSIGERTLDDPDFAPFWAELNRRKAIVFLHPIFRATDAHMRDYELARIAGACFEDTLAALRLLLCGLTDRNPELRVIVPHFGGTLPVIYPRIARRGKADLLRRLYYDTANGYGPALRCACEALGANRLMLGTDFPYIGSIKQNVDYVLEAGLSAADQQQILETTAADLLGLSASVTDTGATRSGSSGFGVTSSGSAGSALSGAGATGSASTGSGSTASGPTDAGYTGSGRTGSGSTASGSTGSGSTAATGVADSGFSRSAAGSSGAAASTGSASTDSGPTDSGSTGSGSASSGSAVSGYTSSRSSAAAGAGGAAASSGAGGSASAAGGGDVAGSRPG